MYRVIQIAFIQPNFDPELYLFLLYLMRSEENRIFSPNRCIESYRAFIRPDFDPEFYLFLLNLLRSEENPIFSPNRCIESCRAFIQPDFDPESLHLDR